MLDCMLAIYHLYIHNLSNIKENGVSDAFSGLLSMQNPKIPPGAASQNPAAAHSAALRAVLLVPHETSPSGASCRLNPFIPPNLSTPTNIRLEQPRL